MSVWEIVIGIIIILVCLFLIGVIMLQEGNSRGMGGITAEVSTDSYLGSNKARTFDAVLARMTKIAAVIFFILTIAISIISYVK